MRDDVRQIAFQTTLAPPYQVLGFTPLRGPEETARAVDGATSCCRRSSAQGPNIMALFALIVDMEVMSSPT